MVISRAVLAFQLNSSRSIFAKRLWAGIVSQDRVFVVVKWAIFLRPAQCSKGGKGDERLETSFLKINDFLQNEVF